MAGQIQLGGGLVPGLCYAQVKKITDDKEKLNQVQVTTTLHAENTGSYAPVVSDFVGNGFGSVVVPNVGDRVIVGFLGGHLNEPVVLGCVYDKDHKPPIQVDKNNEKMLFKFPSGMTLEICNKKDKSKIDIKTSKDHKLTLFDSEEKVVLKDKGGKTSLEVNLKDGKIAMKAEKEISFKCSNSSLTIGDKKVEIKCESGDLNLKFKEIKAQAQANLTLKANSKAAFKGTTVEVSGSGKTDVKGGMVNIG